jgi:hypothetical protein
MIRSCILDLIVEAVRSIHIQANLLTSCNGKIFPSLFISGIKLATLRSVVDLNSFQNFS